MSETATMQRSEDTQKRKGHAGQHLAFLMERETCGSGILTVQEIIEMVDVTPACPGRRPSSGG